MKYLKEFEASDEKYTDGDYILLDLDKILIDNKEMDLDHNPIYDKALINDDCDDGEYPYSIEFYNGEDPEFRYVSEEEIKRKLTPEEIEEFKMMSTANNYNL